MATSALVTLLVAQRDRVRWVRAESHGEPVAAPERVVVDGLTYELRGQVESTAGPRWVYERVGRVA